MKQVRNREYVVYMLTLVTLLFGLVGCGVKPSIMTNPVTSAIVSEPYEYKIEVQGTPPIVFTAKAPEGFQVDKKGVATWKPKDKGRFDVLIEAKNTKGKAKQEFSINVKEKPIPEAYLEGVELGKKIWQEKLYIYKLIKELNEGKYKYKNDPDFRDGLLKGYTQGKEDLYPDRVIEADAGEIVTIIILAGSRKLDFESGKTVGEKLRNNEIMVEQASREKRQSIIGGEVKELAWKSGFIVGYTDTGSYPEHYDYALRMFFALPD